MPLALAKEVKERAEKETPVLGKETRWARDGFTFVCFGNSWWFYKIRVRVSELLLHSPVRAVPRIRPRALV